MDLFEAIKKRKSYRGGFKDTVVTNKHLTMIVEAGLKAPSGCNKQTTEFVIVNEQKILKNIHEMAGANKPLQQCQALIVCVIDKKPKPLFGNSSFQIEDCAAAVENILLAITALGYETVWLDGWLRGQNRAKEVGKLLGVPNNKVVRVILPIGIANEEYEKPAKKLFYQRAFFNKYS